MTTTTPPLDGCAECGAANTGSKFCPDCGAPTGAGAASTGADPASAPSAPDAATSDGAPAGIDDVATTPLRRVPAGKPLASAASAPAPSTQRRTLWVGTACLLAVIGLAVGAVGLVVALNANQTTRTLRGQLVTLRERVGGDEGRVTQVAAQLTKIPGRATMAAVQSNVAALQGQLAGQGRALGKIQSQAATYSNCLPELQTELSGLSINWTIDAANVGSSSFFINNNSQISHDCTKLLYGG